ncbi:hypothetical protein AB0H77_18810 [Streptomyces sp. NPDC050844]|uniref:hypothetical protein n=1 Tax=Streptomyces sp. NPDC050844 TaxID=3155790 RepID=UPI0033FDD520
MEWKTEEFGASHEGWVGAVLDDGSEPKEAVLDSGSSANFHRTREWWAYSGKLNRSRATVARGACSCGWRGEEQYPIDWDEVDAFTDEFPMKEPYDEWRQHIRDVQAQTIPLPPELEELLGRVEEQLYALVEDAPLAALKAVAALERTAKSISHRAAEYAAADDLSMESISQALGLSQEDARSRLLRYSLMR